MTVYGAITIYGTSQCGGYVIVDGRDVPVGVPRGLTSTLAVTIEDEIKDIAEIERGSIMRGPREVYCWVRCKDLVPAAHRRASDKGLRKNEEALQRQRERAERDARLPRLHTFTTMQQLADNRPRGPHASVPPELREAWAAELREKVEASERERASKRPSVLVDLEVLPWE